MQRVFDIINYKFNDVDILNNAFTHSSYAHDNNISSNERLEFLGDSILGLVVSEYLYKNYTHDEGKLSKLKAQLVSANVLKDIIDNLGLFEYVKLGASLRGQKNADFSSIKADLFEAVLGAIYLDGGLANAKSFIFKFLDLQTLINNFQSNNQDYKTALQELVQQDASSKLEYKSFKKLSQDNVFVSEVYINNNLVSQGEGKSKKLAEIQAAKQAIQILKK